MATETPVLGLTKPEVTDLVGATITALADNFDIIDAHAILSGLDASKPAAGTAGRLYVATDTRYIYRDSGSEWVAVGIDPTVVPAARVYHDAAQSIASATWTALAFNSERFDTDNIHDTATNNSRLTCKTAGKYQITANVSFAANATGVRQLALRLNGTTYIAHTNTLTIGSGEATLLSVSTLYALAVNDYVEALVYQSSGGALDVSAGAAYSPEFMMVRVG